MPNSISFCSQVWKPRGAEDRPGPCPTLCQDWYQSLSSTHLPRTPFVMVAVPPKPCGISMSYWQPHNSGKGVPGGGAQAGSTEGPCPAPSQPLSPSHPAATAWWAWLRVCCSLNHCSPEPKAGHLQPVGLEFRIGTISVPSVFGLKLSFEFECLTPGRSSMELGTWTFQFRTSSGPGRDHRAKA